jgi:hypothetical protein
MDIDNGFSWIFTNLTSKVPVDLSDGMYNCYPTGFDSVKSISFDQTLESNYEMMIADFRLRKPALFVDD